ncbi:hypothetical protein HRI_004538500 [Hibiscus trionum]|uniref:WAT1-related protein n=1 Tax=Hibiscus trionum TaxID=183268 RepID=A0A9W7MKZ0_HIBTR|nr:hypothetical protein HRI_004538500 [Hibiscus trionum]
MDCTALLLLPAPFFSYRSRVLPPLRFPSGIGFRCKPELGHRWCVSHCSVYPDPTLVNSTQIMAEYPAELTVMFFYNLFVCFIALVVGLVVERNVSAWRIGSNIALASVVCSGIFSSCLCNIAHSWALRLKGPVYVAMFEPFSIAVAFVLGIIFLADTPYLGSLIGATTISIGFYMVMWGKAKEATPEDKGNGSSNGTTIGSPSSHKVPLLQSYKTEQE